MMINLTYFRYVNLKEELIDYIVERSEDKAFFKNGFSRWQPTI